jgi:hypothetical protein
LGGLEGIGGGVRLGEVDGVGSEDSVGGVARRAEGRVFGNGGGGTRLVVFGTVGSNECDEGAFLLSLNKEIKSKY